MLVNFLFSPFTRRGNRIGSLSIECTLSETHSATSRITNQPVEEGSTISDHIVNDPEKVNITGFISDTPLDASYSNYSQLAFDTLYQIRDTRNTISVVTNYRVYQDMVITNISVPRTQRSGQSIEFSVELTKIRKAGSNTLGLFGALLAGDTEGIIDQASSALDLGRLNPSAATGLVETRVTDTIGRLF